MLLVHYNNVCVISDRIPQHMMHMQYKNNMMCYEVSTTMMCVYVCVQSSYYCTVQSVYHNLCY